MFNHLQQVLKKITIRTVTNDFGHVSFRIILIVERFEFHIIHLFYKRYQALLTEVSNVEDFQP